MTTNNVGDNINAGDTTFYYVLSWVSLHTATVCFHCLPVP